jgi:hypothetical protein
VPLLHEVFMSGHALKTHGVPAGLALILCVPMMAPPASGATLELPFYEGFEPVGGDPADCAQDNRGHWPWNAEWVACETPFNFNCPDETYPNPQSSGWGPVKFESWPDLCAGGQVYAGYRSGRQPIADPYWYSMYHEFAPPTGVGDLHAEVWQYDPATVICTCECNCDPDGPQFGYPDGRPNYQAQGWLFLINADRSEYYVLGVNSHHTWTRLSWATKSDGWQATDVPRVNGWRKLEIIVHPFSGTAGDVEFRVNDQVVGSGRREPGGVVDRIRLGAEPGLITQRHLTNTFEEFRYDEVRVFFVPALCPSPRMDFDADLDVDQEDFGVFQSCITGPADPVSVFNEAACHCADADSDQDVDLDDFGVFQLCATGPNVRAETDCAESPP